MQNQSSPNRRKYRDIPKEVSSITPFAECWERYTRLCVPTDRFDPNNPPHIVREELRRAFYSGGLSAWILTIEPGPRATAAVNELLAEALRKMEEKAT